MNRGSSPRERRTHREVKGWLDTCPPNMPLLTEPLDLLRRLAERHADLLYRDGGYPFVSFTSFMMFIRPPARSRKRHPASIALPIWKRKCVSKGNLGNARWVSSKQIPKSPLRLFPPKKASLG